MFKLLSLACPVILFLMVGCADRTREPSQHWDRAGMEDFSYAMLSEDQDECRAKAAEKVMAPGKSPSLEVARRNEIVQCMEEKGWVWRDDSSYHN